MSKLSVAMFACGVASGFPLGYVACFFADKLARFLAQKTMRWLSAAIGAKP
jgi:hypothetical protein